MNYSLYIHIPYCKSKCNYCDFYSSKLCQNGVDNAYIKAVKHEFDSYAPKSGKAATVYFGGGTPSLLAPAQVAGMVEHFSPLNNAEITLELNPEDYSFDKLAEYKKAGVNRLSIGVQTVWDESLKRLGRRHNALKAKEAVEGAQKAGFDNLSIDIMLGLPFYSKEEFEDTLSFANNDAVKHISAYLLKIEENTAFGKNTPKGIPDSDDMAEIYLYAANRIEELGFKQYEISNFAKKGYESRHNLAYWQCKDYLGIGPSAHSCLNGRRFFFENSIEKFVEGKAYPHFDGECTWEDYLMLSLRLADGLDEKTLKNHYSVEFSEKQRAFIALADKQGLCKKTENGFKLTQKGFLVQNSIVASLL